MSKLKTIVPILLVAFMFLGMSKISAATVDAGLSLNKPNITAKETVEIKINFNQSVGATEFELNFDEAKFDFVKVSNDVNYNPITKKANYFSATKSINEAVFTFKSKTDGTAKFELAGLRTSDLNGNMYTSNIKENNLDVDIAKPNDNNNNGDNPNNSNNNIPPQTGNKVPNPSTGTEDDNVDKTDVMAPVPEEEINTPNYNGDQTDNQNKNSTNNNENNSIKNFVDNYGVITVVVIVLIIAAAIVIVRNRRKV